METVSPRSGTDGLCATVVEAIADRTGTEPATMSPPLYSVVDLEALAVLLDSAANATVTFEYQEQEVLVHADGAVRVDGQYYDSPAEQAANGVDATGEQEG